MWIIIISGCTFAVLCDATWILKPPKLNSFYSIWAKTFSTVLHSGKKRPKLMAWELVDWLTDTTHDMYSRTVGSSTYLYSPESLILRARSAGLKPAGWLVLALTKSLFTSCQNSIFLSQQSTRTIFFNPAERTPAGRKRRGGWKGAAAASDYCFFCF